MHCEPQSGSRPHRRLASLESSLPSHRCHQNHSIPLPHRQRESIPERLSTACGSGNDVLREVGTCFYCSQLKKQPGFHVRRRLSSAVFSETYAAINRRLDRAFPGYFSGLTVSQHAAKQIEKSRRPCLTGYRPTGNKDKGAKKTRPRNQFRFGPSGRPPVCRSDCLLLSVGQSTERIAVICL